jgi:hypothetical protein
VGGTTEEAAGYVFNQNATCHATDLTTDHSFRNNGIVVEAAHENAQRH